MATRVGTIKTPSMLTAQMVFEEHGFALTLRALPTAQILRIKAHSKKDERDLRRHLRTEQRTRRKLSKALAQFYTTASL